MPPRKRLGQLLTELKVIDEHQLQSALGHQKQWGGKLGVILVQKEFCREEQMISALSQHLGMPAVRLSEVKIDQRAVKTVSRSVAERLHVFAYEVTGSGRSEVITIAMSDPTDLSAVDQLAFHTGKRIKPMLAGDSEVIAAIQQHYPAEKTAEEAQLPAGSRPFVEGARQGPGASGRLTPVSPLAPVPPAATPTPSFSRRVEPPRPPPPVMPAAPHAHAAPAPTGGTALLRQWRRSGSAARTCPPTRPWKGWSQSPRTRKAGRAWRVPRSWPGREPPPTRWRTSRRSTRTRRSARSRCRESTAWSQACLRRRPRVPRRMPRPPRRRRSTIRRRCRDGRRDRTKASRWRSRTRRRRTRPRKAAGAKRPSCRWTRSWGPPTCWRRLRRIRRRPATLPMRGTTSPTLSPLPRERPRPPSRRGRRQPRRWRRPPRSWIPPARVSRCSIRPAIRRRPPKRLRSRRRAGRKNPRRASTRGRPMRLPGRRPPS